MMRRSGVEAAADAPRDDLSTARRRRLSAVPPEELPLGEDALELVNEDPGAGDRPRPASRRPTRSGRGAGRGLPRRHRPTKPIGDPIDDTSDEPTGRRRVRRRAEDGHPGEPPARKPVEEDPWPRLRAELGRDHVRRRVAGLTEARCRDRRSTGDPVACRPLQPPRSAGSASSLGRV